MTFGQGYKQPKATPQEGARRIISPTSFSSHPWNPAGTLDSHRDSAVLAGSLRDGEYQGRGGWSEKRRVFLTGDDAVAELVVSGNFQDAN